LQVRRNDEVSLDEIRAIEAGAHPCVARPVFAARIRPVQRGHPHVRAMKAFPIFGVCLGHQCIGHVFGAEVVVNYRMMHGKTSPIKHNGKDLFAGMAESVSGDALSFARHQARHAAGRAWKSPPRPTKAKSWASSTRTLPVWGVQFHPESILTENGRRF
jgi:anthranilate/para-aminobenzoate synthase component II